MNADHAYDLLDMTKHFDEQAEECREVIREFGGPEAPGAEPYNARFLAFKRAANDVRMRYRRRESHGAPEDFGLPENPPPLRRILGR